MDEEVTQAFVAKVDAFAATLLPVEQAMLAHLVGGDEVTGFGADEVWPGLTKLMPSPMSFEAGIAKSGGGNDILRFEKSGGGNSI